MTSLQRRSPIRKRLDRAGIALSALCAAHCVLALIVAGAFGGLLLSPVFHEAGLALAVALGVVAFGIGLARHRGFDVLLPAAFGLGLMALALAADHGPIEAGLTIVGVALLAFAHWSNLRRAH
jgi:hypothetical protein